MNKPRTVTITIADNEDLSGISLKINYGVTKQALELMGDTYQPTPAQVFAAQAYPYIQTALQQGADHAKTQQAAQEEGEEPPANEESKILVPGQT